MSLNAKPFTVSQLLRFRSYLPKPNVYAHVDLNQAAEALVTGAENISDAIGSLFQYLQVTVTSLTLTRFGNSSGGAYSLNYDITFARKSGAPVVPNGNVYEVKTKTVSFEIPGQVYASGILAGSSSDPLPELSFWLWAKTDTINFAGDPVQGGVNGTGFPGAIASSDAQVWSLHPTATLRVTAEATSGIPVAYGGLVGYTPIRRIAHVGYRYIGYDSGRSPAYIYHVPVFVPEAIDPLNLLDITALNYQQNCGNGDVDAYGNNTVLIHPSLDVSGSVAKLWLKIKELEAKIKYYHP